MDIKNATERRATTIFLDYNNINYTDSDLRNSEEYDSVDVYLDKTKLEFQVTTVEGDIIKLLRFKKHEGVVNDNDALERFVINPIQKKILKYRSGASISNTTLLIHTILVPPDKWLHPINNEIKTKLDDLYKNSGFKDIYIVVDIENRVIPLFQRSQII